MFLQSACSSPERYTGKKKACVLALLLSVCTQPCYVCPTSASGRDDFGSDLVVGAHLSSSFGRDFPVGSPHLWWWHFWDVGSAEILTAMKKFVQITGTILLQLVVFVYRVCFLKSKFCKWINLYRNVKLLLIAFLLTGQQLLTDSVATAVRCYKEKLPLWRSLPSMSTFQEISSTYFI